MRKIRTLKNTIIFGFDSAWTDHPNRPGAICAVSYDKTGQSRLHEPVLASFSEAAEFIMNKQQSYSFSMIALDQSLVVNNSTGMRPVEKIAGSVIGRAGGGVQPSNTSVIGMFDPEAPLWKFLKKIKEPNRDPLIARNSEAGRYIIEVFPALTLLNLKEEFSQPRRAPKYNPSNRKKFRIDDWKSVIKVVSDTALDLDIPDLSSWAKRNYEIDKPRKRDQDKLDAAICALIGIIWLCCEDRCSIMIGNMDTGYMITPVLEEVRLRLEQAVKKQIVLE